MILYAIFRVLCWFSLPAYFKRIRVIGKQNRIFSGPVILVSNHPNTMMDAIHAAYHLRQRIGFLANASIFNNAFAARIWRYLQVIPVYRQEDLPKGERMDNTDSFRECYAFLNKGKTLMILPEGSSWNEMKLRTIKSGTARIALKYQSQYGSEQKLRILPVSLNYSDPPNFRSKLIKVYGEPIELDQYVEAYQEHPRKAARQLTETIRQRLSEHMVILDDKDREQMFRYLRTIYSRELDEKAEEQGKSELKRRQFLASKIQETAQEIPDAFKSSLEQFKQYFRGMNQLGLRDGQFKNPDRSYWLEAILSSILLVLGSPLFIAGLILNAPLFFVPAKLVPKLAKDVEYHAVMKMIMSWLVGLLWIPLVLILFYQLSDLPGWWTLILAVGAPIVGIMTWVWYQCWLRCKAFWNWGLQKDEIQKLRAQRQECRKLWDERINWEEAK